MSVLYYVLLYVAMILMGVAMSYLIFISRQAHNPLKRLLVYLFLSMMNGMLVGPLIYLVFPGLITLDGAFEISAATMTIEVIPFLIKFVSNALNNRVEGNIRLLQFFVILFVIIDEVIMSIEFNILTRPDFLATSQGFLPLVAKAISDYWFIFPMSLEMILTTIFLRKLVPKFALTILILQSIIMLLSPTAVSTFHWGQVTVYLSAAVMTPLLILVFEYLYRKNSVHLYLGNYLLLLLAAYSMMMAGVFIWQYNGTVYAFSAGTLLNMVIFLHVALNPSRSTEGRKLFWLANRKWTFSFLLLVFIAEFFMGATIDNQYFGANAFVNSLGIIPLSGVPYAIPAKAGYDFVVGVSGISLSPWFYAMMGFEMGALIVFKALKTRSRETVVRLGLMMSAYALYTIYLPSFFFSDPAKVPFIGWSMGIGTAGAFSPLYLAPIGISYAITAVLSLLFGSRNLCSTLCPAPAMYQGTFYNAMKKFNRSGKTAKSLTGADRLGGIVYRSVSFSVYTALGVAAVLSYFNSTGFMTVSVYGTDATLFVYLILFGFAWYLVFILMPFVGSYGCLNTGFCSWGNFNRFFSRIGLFRLKVRSINQCVTCQTKDCATACPVGNYGQPGSFIKAGEYRDSRCVGIGDCVEACPYDNIFFYDVRHWVKGKFGKRVQAAVGSVDLESERTSSK